ncbi:MAG: precorrin-6A reductase [Clostridiales bacterium]|nr:precorrin-6A reductase [Clostridiales bacterium]
MIWIIGGTCEAVELVERIDDRYKYIITAATEVEREFIDNGNLVVCRMDEAGMEDFIKRNSIKVVVDVSHPYAFEVTKNAREAAHKCNIEYIRYVRKKTDDMEGCVYMKSIHDCLEFLKTVNGCVFFTTGSKNIKEFESVRGENRFVYRVLPSVESIKECMDSNVVMKDIIASLGPYSEDFNAAMFKEYGALYVVMKDSGIQGGTGEKIRACRRLDIKAVIIGRKDEEGISDIDDIIKKLEHRNLQ